VVDDDPEIVYVLKHGVIKNGFLVDAFTDPEQAFLRLKQMQMIIAFLYQMSGCQDYQEYTNDCF
jgi:CheY-like chemotaxis protein